MILALPVHNISNICYTKEAENSHIKKEKGNSLEIQLKLKKLIP